MTLPESRWLFPISWAGLWGCFCFAQFLALPFLQAGSKRSPVRVGNQVRGVKDGGVSENALDFSSWPELTTDSYSARSIGSPSSINIPCGVCPPSTPQVDQEAAWFMETGKTTRTGNICLPFLRGQCESGISLFLHC